jgi:hypothetical protein
LSHREKRVTDEFDYAQEAELYSGGARGSRRGKQLHYWRFDTAAEALQYAFEVMPAAERPSAALELGEDRYTSDEMKALYDDPHYPLPRVAAEATTPS